MNEGFIGLPRVSWGPSELEEGAAVVRYFQQLLALLRTPRG